MSPRNNPYHAMPGDLEKELAQIEEKKKLQEQIEQLSFQIKILQSANNSKSANKEETEETSIAIQLLILHYLNLLPQIDIPNTKKAELLQVLFKTEGCENIRISLSNVGGKGSKFINKKNLIFLRELFQRTGLKEALALVNKDLQKLENKGA